VGNSIFKFLRDKLLLPINRVRVPSVFSRIRRPTQFVLLGYGFVPTYRKGSWTISDEGRIKQGSALREGTATADERKISIRSGTVQNGNCWKQSLNGLPERRYLLALMSVFSGSTGRYVAGLIISNMHPFTANLKSWRNGWETVCAIASGTIGFLTDPKGWAIAQGKEPLLRMGEHKKRRSLIRLGVDQEMAYAWSMTRLGGWRVAQSPILGTTITLDRLKHRGYVIWLDYYHKLKLH